MTRAIVSCKVWRIKRAKKIYQDSHQGRPLHSFAQFKGGTNLSRKIQQLRAF